MPDTPQERYPLKYEVSVAIMLKLSAYLTVNTRSFHFKHQVVNVEQEHNQWSSSESEGTIANRCGQNARRVTSGFRRELHEICALLRYYAACIGKPSQKFRDKLTVPSTTVKKILNFLILEDGTVSMSRNVGKDFYSKTNQMHQCLKFILFGVKFYMFRTVFPTILRSSKTVYTAAVSVWHMSVAVCTVLNSWWWTERPSETCRVLLQIQ